jgi:hypothetical protein
MLNVEESIYNVIYSGRGGVTAEEIAKKLPISENKIDEAIANLLKQRKVFPFKGGYAPLETREHVQKEVDAILRRYDAEYDPAYINQIKKMLLSLPIHKLNDLTEF